MNAILATPEIALQDLDQAHARVQALEAEVADLRRRLQDTLALNRITGSVASVLEPTAAFEITCTELARAYKVPQVALGVLDPSRTFLNVVAEYCEPGRISGLGEQIAVANNPIMDYILAHHVPLVIPDAQHDPLLPPSVRDLMARRNTASLLIMPVLIEDEVVGTVGIDAIERRTFSEADLALAQAASAAISQALYNAKLHQAIQQELAERKRAEAIIKQQAAILAELSTPLIPLTDKVLVLPLIGAVDAARAQQIMETLLSGVVHHKADAVIVDITGLPFVDTHVASVLTQTARAVQLLGATTIITGIRPEVAQTLVGLGIQLQGVLTFGTLQSGIKYAIQRL